MKKTGKQPTKTAWAGTHRPKGNAQPSSHRWLVYFSILAVAVAVSFYLVWSFVLPKVPPEIAGNWRVEGGPMGNANLEIKRNGSFVARVPGKDEFVEGRVEMREKSLLFFTVNPYTSIEEPKHQSIKQMSERGIVLEDPAGKIMRLVRRD